MSGDILTSAQESAMYHQQNLQQFPWQKASIRGWYTFKCSLTCLGPWTAIFPWIFLLLGKALSHRFHPLVTLLQLPDTLLPLPYSILKGKQLPELLQAKISWLHLKTWRFKLSQSLWVLVPLRLVLPQVSTRVWLLQLGVWCYTCKIKVVAQM